MYAEFRDIIDQLNGEKMEDSRTLERMLCDTFEDAPDWPLNTSKGTQYLMPVLVMLCHELDVSDAVEKAKLMKGLLRSCWELTSVSQDVEPSVDIRSLSSEIEADKAAVKMLKNMDECQGCVLPTHVEWPQSSC
jgi:hypothetical protein